MELNFRYFLNNNLGLPTVEKTAEIKVIEYNKTPIRIILSDGTILLFSIDQFRRIPGGEPKVGKKMKVVFQRHPNDKSNKHSQIHACHVL